MLHFTPLQARWRCTNFPNAVVHALPERSTLLLDIKTQDCGLQEHENMINFVVLQGAARTISTPIDAWPPV